MYWPNGKRTIRDYETIDQFTKHICSRFTNNYYYHGERIITREGEIYSWDNVETYAGADGTTAWGNNVRRFYKAMM